LCEKEEKVDPPIRPRRKREKKKGRKATVVGEKGDESRHGAAMKKGRGERGSDYAFFDAEIWEGRAPRPRWFIKQQSVRKKRGGKGGQVFRRKWRAEQKKGRKGRRRRATWLMVENAGEKAPLKNKKEREPARHHSQRRRRLARLRKASGREGPQNPSEHLENAPVLGKKRKNEAVTLSWARQGKKRGGL